MDIYEKHTIEELLVSKGIYIGPTAGASMLPMLKEGRDTIVVAKKTERLKRLDVALYKRGDTYVLHRVLQAIDGGYIIRGDNCYVDEKVSEEAVIGVLIEFFRKDKRYSRTNKKYLRYAEKRLKTYKCRRFFMAIKSRFKGVIKKILHVK